MYARRFITYLAASLLVACSADEPDGPDQGSGTAMQFSVRTEETLSRANNVPFNHFNVFVDMRREDVLNKTVLMDKVEVTFNETADRWVYPVTQYWFPGYEYSFIAFTPKTVLNATETAAAYNDSQLTFKYTVPVDHTHASDILVATHRRMYTDGSGEVMLHFGHLLSRINIAPALKDNEMDDDAFLSVYRVELIGIANKASFKLNAAPLQTNAQTDDRALEITDCEGKMTWAVDFPEPKIFMNKKPNTALLDDSNAFLMIPQSFSTDSDASLVLTYAVGDSPTMKQFTMPLRRLRWDPGTSYNIMLTADRLGLKLEAMELVDWEVTNTEIVVPVE